MTPLAADRAEASAPAVHSIKTNSEEISWKTVQLGLLSNDFLQNKLKQGQPKTNPGLIFSTTDRRLWVTGTPVLRSQAPE